MTHGFFSWKALTRYGVLLCLFGFFGPEFDVWGVPSYVWALRAGFLLFVGGLGMAAVLVATDRLAVGSWVDNVHFTCGNGRWNTFQDTGSAAAGFSSPSVNVDGTPMMDGGMFDVMGKAYGDSGTTFSNDFGGGMDASSIGSSNW